MTVNRFRIINPVTGRVLVDNIDTLKEAEKLYNKFQAHNLYCLDIEELHIVDDKENWYAA